MTLQQKLDERRAQSYASLPPETVHIMKRATEDLRNSGLVEQALNIADSAPDFALPGVDGKEVSFRETLKKGPLVLTFYRGVW